MLATLQAVHLGRAFLLGSAVLFEAGFSQTTCAVGYVAALSGGSCPTGYAIPGGSSPSSGGDSSASNATNATNTSSSSRLLVEEFGMPIMRKRFLQPACPCKVRLFYFIKGGVMEDCSVFPIKLYWVGEVFIMIKEDVVLRELLMIGSF